jgi:hypothetical protein
LQSRLALWATYGLTAAKGATNVVDPVIYQSKAACSFRQYTTDPSFQTTKPSSGKPLRAPELSTMRLIAETQLQRRYAKNDCEGDSNNHSHFD